MVSSSDKIPPIQRLRGRLEEAGHGNFDESDIGPILDLIDQGCDLEADILPTVARMVPAPA
jgi:hypothetical protein